MSKKKQERLDEIIVEVADWKEQKAHAEGEISELTAEAMQILEDMGIRSHKSSNGQVTLVESSTLQINEASLKKRLGLPMWKKITRLVMDKGLLEAHIASGDIDATVVASCSSEIPRKPYLKITPGSAKASKTSLRDQIKDAPPVSDVKPGKRRKQKRGM